MEKFLTEETKKLLRYQHRQEKDGRTRDRIKAILLDEETISKHIDEYVTRGKLQIQTGGSASKINSCQNRLLRAHLSENLYSQLGKSR
jgi:hypothetical protein